MNKKNYKNFKEFIIKRPLILVGIFVILLGIILILIGRFIATNTIQELLQDIAILVFLIIILIPIVETYSAYKRNERPFDFYCIPLFLSVLFICLTLVLMLFFGILRDIYINSVELELNHIIFPVAIFALGISLYYFFIVQFSTDRKLDLISRELNEIKEGHNEYPIQDKTRIETSIPSPKKDYLNISDEDKIIFEHLFDRHNNILSYNDILDTKVAQVIAFNGVILGIVLFNVKNANLPILFFGGVLIIFLNILIGLHAYGCRNFFVGASVKFFKEYDTFLPGVGMKELKEQLLHDINRNQKTHEVKAMLFNYMTYIIFIGLGVILVGYYG